VSTLLDGLAQALQHCGGRDALLADPAGQAAWLALRLPMQGAEPDPVWVGLSARIRMDGTGLARWVAQVLEDASFKMEAEQSAGAAEVVITPLTRAVLRPFSAVVMPGADDRQLGSSQAIPGWVHGRQSEEMGLPTPTTLRDAQWASFLLLLAQPDTTCLYRMADGSEPLGPSPWFERWSLHTGRALDTADDVRPLQESAATPMHPPLPRVNGLPLPERISSTSYDSLRQCPYQFFARYLLALRSVDELEEGLDRADYGNWLHAVLQGFHETRQLLIDQPSLADDLALWLRMTQEVTVSQGLDREQTRSYFLPYAAAVDILGQHYLKWLHEHERVGDDGHAGWRFAQAEQAVEMPWSLEDARGRIHPVRLVGKLDRIDRRGHGEGAQWSVIDYKTGSLHGLKARQKAPLEDTQLAFYAALAEFAKDSPAVSAAYLHLDDKAATELPHQDVMASAQVVMKGVREDLLRIANGAPMPALGEGAVCDYCDARGLCRRDHWTLEGAGA